MTIIRSGKFLRPRGVAALFAALAGLSLGVPAFAQTDSEEHYEWEADEGYHEEEWYDPSDWWDDDFDEGRVDYEADWYEWGWGDDLPERSGMDRDEYAWDEDDEFAERTFPRGYESDEGWVWEADRYDPTQTRNYDDYWGEDAWDSPYKYQTVRGVLAQEATSDRNGQHAQQGDSPSVQLQGKVDDWTRVQLRGHRDAHTLLRIELDDGNEATVNLGPNASLSRLGLKEDAQIAVMGPMGAINDRDVVMAQRVRVGDRTIRMTNWSPDHRAQRDRSAELRGELTGWSRVSLDGHRDSHTLVKMKLEDDREAIVNLGPNVSVSKLDLSKGDRVAVYGPVGSVNDRDVVMAQRVRVGDRTIRMDNWSPESRERNTKQEQRASRQGDDRRRATLASERDDQRQRRIVERVMSDWPETSKKAARAMLEEYGLPSGVTGEMMIWRESGPFVKTIVYSDPVQHNFPVPHEDVLEQYVNFEVPPEKMDELARYDGSVVVFLTDGLMSARCDREAMNILALNLAAEIINDDRSVEEARRKYADVARAYKQGNRPEITQRLAFETESANTDRHNRPDERFERERASR